MPSKDFDKPIQCPHCKQPLKTVQMEDVKIFEYDEEEKKFVDNGQGTVTNRCHNCGKV